MKVSATLIRFSKSRETAYLQHGRLTGARAKAITEIRRVADFNKNKSEQVQLRAVNQVESQLREILPHEESRNCTQRDKILSLISQAKQLIHASTPTPTPAPPDGRAARPIRGSEGVQLRLL